MPRAKRKSKHCSDMSNKRWSSNADVKTKTLENETWSADHTSSSNLRLKSIVSNDIPVERKSGQYVLVNIDCLNKLLDNFNCPECHEKKLQFILGAKLGFAHDIQIICDSCENSKSALSCKKSNNSSYDVNLRVTQAFQHIGKGYSAVEKFCMIMDLPVYSSKTFRNCLAEVHEANKSAYKVIMAGIHTKIKDAYCGDASQQLKDITEIAVSFDGTWMTRGHSSLIGVGCVIDILTGFAVDFEVMSKICRCCKNAKRDMGETTAEFHIWFEGHADSCELNHTGSSGLMELKAAEKLWERSEALGFRYTTVLSDGDSKTYNHLVESKVYGNVRIKKEECVNHVSKRLGTGLREAVKKSKAQGITLGGKKHGSLKEETIKKLTKYYQGAILKNKGDSKKMKTAIYATLFHAISTDEKPQHSKCPQGADSWCYYQAALAKDESPGSHKTNIRTPVNESLLPFILPVYQRLASDDLLERCIRCATQNSNESLHNMIWSKCPKDKFVHSNRVKSSVSEAVCEFNVGLKKTVMEQQLALGLQFGDYTSCLGTILLKRKKSFKSEEAMININELAR